jgi:hypothetical protein
LGRVGKETFDQYRTGNISNPSNGEGIATSLAHVGHVTLKSGSIIGNEPINNEPITPESSTLNLRGQITQLTRKKASLIT